MVGTLLVSGGGRSRRRRGRRRLSGQVGHSPGILTTTGLRGVSRARDITFRRSNLVFGRGQAGRADALTASLGSGNGQLVRRADGLARRLGQEAVGELGDTVRSSRLVAARGSSQRGNSGEEEEVLHGV